MVGMKLIKIDRSYIENFLKNDNEKIDKEYIVFTAVLNIIAFYVSAYFSENKMLWGILFTGVNAIILQSLIYFLKKMKHSKKNYYLYTGIYTTLWTISFGILSCVLLRSELGRNSLWIVIIEVLGAIGFAVINYMMYIKKICHKNQYISSSNKISSQGSLFAFSFVIMLSLKFISNVSVYIVVGIACGLFSVISASNIYFFIKSYCYSLIGDK